MLHLARLTDKSTTAGKTNLTVLNLPSLVADAGLKDELAHLVEEAKKRTEFCRDWRNREFAHQDLLLALSGRKGRASAKREQGKYGRGFGSNHERVECDRAALL